MSPPHPLAYAPLNQRPASYFAIPFNLALYLLGKFLYRKEPGIPKPEEADLVTGKQEIDEDEAYWLKQKEGQNLTKAQKFWDWLF